MIIASALSTNAKGSFFQRQPGFDYWTMGLFLRGTQAMSLCGNTLKTRKNLIVIIPQNTPYSFETKTESQDIWAIFSPELRIASDLTQITSESGYGCCMLNALTPYSRDILHSIHEMERWWSMKVPMYDLAENALERAVMLLAQSQRKSSESDTDRRLNRAIAFIHQNYRQQISVSDLASAANLSTSRFAHVFSEREGMSPASYIEHYRMEQARELLLSTQMSIGAIGDAMGYSNQFHFSARFKKLTGQSPQAFRVKPIRTYHSIIPSSAG